jgi:hypothetical protein
MLDVTKQGWQRFSAMPPFFVELKILPGFNRLPHGLVYQRASQVRFDVLL